MKRLSIEQLLEVYTFLLCEYSNAVALRRLRNGAIADRSRGKCLRHPKDELLLLESCRRRGPTLSIFHAFVRCCRPRTFGLASRRLPACQQEINDSQHHHHESIDKEPAISQNEDVTENYGSHPHNSQSRS
jgi:hypothetical protein